MPLLLACSRTTECTTKSCCWVLVDKWQPLINRTRCHALSHHYEEYTLWSLPKQQLHFARFPQAGLLSLPPAKLKILVELQTLRLNGETLWVCETIVSYSCEIGEMNVFFARDVTWEPQWLTWIPHDRDLSLFHWTTMSQQVTPCQCTRYAIQGETIVLILSIRQPHSCSLLFFIRLHVFFFLVTSLLQKSHVGLKKKGGKNDHSHHQPDDSDAFLKAKNDTPNTSAKDIAICKGHKAENRSCARRKQRGGVITTSTWSQFLKTEQQGWICHRKGQ